MARRRSSLAGRRRLSWVMAATAIVSLTVLLATHWQAGAGVVGTPSTTSVAAAGAVSPSQSATSPIATSGGPSSTSAPTGSPPPRAAPPAGRFGLGLLIADRGNGRLLIVDDAKRILWKFPLSGSLPNGQRFSADDAFLAPDGRTIVANDEGNQVIDRIDIATRRVIWQYGHYGQSGSAVGFLHTPDDAYPLANGNITVADIRNCRILEINPAKRIVRHWGVAGSCSHRPPTSFDNPNGDTPLPDGGLLTTEIGGSRIVRLSRTGRVMFDIHAPVGYPSDAQLDSRGNVLVVDYSNPGVILRISPRGHVLQRYGPRIGPGRLDHPSLAIMLADGTIALNDDFRARVIVIDPRTNRIVWQYGRTDVSGRGPGRLLEPDGIDLIPVGTVLA